MPEWSKGTVCKTVQPAVQIRSSPPFLFISNQTYHFLTSTIHIDEIDFSYIKIIISNRHINIGTQKPITYFLNLEYYIYILLIVFLGSCMKRFTIIISFLLVMTSCSTTRNGYFYSGVDTIMSQSVLNQFLNGAILSAMASDKKRDPKEFDIYKKRLNSDDYFAYYSSAMTSEFDNVTLGILRNYFAESKVIKDIEKENKSKSNVKVSYSDYIENFKSRKDALERFEAIQEVIKISFPNNEDANFFLDVYKIALRNLSEISKVRAVSYLKANLEKNRMNYNLYFYRNISMETLNNLLKHYKTEEFKKMRFITSSSRKLANEKVLSLIKNDIKKLYKDKVSEL